MFFSISILLNLLYVWEMMNKRDVGQIVLHKQQQLQN